MESETWNDLNQDREGTMDSNPNFFHNIVIRFLLILMIL